jgi:hypothetical protein
MPLSDEHRSSAFRGTGANFAACPVLPPLTPQYRVLSLFAAVYPDQTKKPLV